MDQWLLTASIRVMALSHASPDGPRAVQCLLTNRQRLVHEVTDFLHTKVEPLISEARELRCERGQCPTTEVAKKQKRKKRSAGETPEVLLKQVDELKVMCLGIMEIASGVKVCVLIEIKRVARFTSIMIIQQIITSFHLPVSIW